MDNNLFSNHLIEAKDFILGEKYGPLESNIQEIVDNISEIFENNYKELSRLKKKNKKLESRMFRDSLTGITNRGKFDILLKKKIKKWELFSLLFFDLDYFKKVNDIYWHLSWDLVLKMVANEIKTKVKSTDDFARYWWEEFIIILPWTDIKWWEIFSQRIRKIIKNLKIKNNEWNNIKVTISIWVVEKTSEDDVDSILKRADNALYRAKDWWRNRVECW